MIQRILIPAACLVFIAWCSPATVSAAGTGGGDSGAINSQPAVPRSPEDMAKAFYRDGVRQKERAWKQEEKAAKAKNDKARDKALARAQKAYQKAVDYQIRALQSLPTHYEAANELGYALRKTGDFKRAIGAYNLALELKPDFWQAVEYRGEALLAMGFFEETKEAYMTLFREDQDLAAELMTAIETWLSDQPQDAAGVAELAQWVSQRKMLTSFAQDPKRTTASRW